MVVLLGVFVYIQGPSIAPKVPSEAWQVFGGAIAIVVGLLAIPAASIGQRMVLLQMEQAEEHRSTDRELARAMSDLTKELRRRREIPASLTLALFGTPENRIPADADK
jgi:hypothetical protein